jgi:acyl-CoA synthetase (AMP-forming)/AMP-acid ligase II
LEKLTSFSTNRTIPEYLKSNAQSFPDKIALVAWSGLENKRVRISYSQLNQFTNILANSFLDIGIVKGDRVSIFMDNEQGIECMISFYASHKIGAINVPINTRYFGEELQYILQHCEAKGIVTSNQHLPKILEVIDSCQNIEFIIVVGEIISQSGHLIKMYPFEELRKNPNENDPAILVEAHDDSDWLYTSGTTGRPKGVMHTHSSSVATGYAVGGAIGITSHDIYQSAFPFFTSSGCHFNPLSVLVNGATFVMDRQFNVDETLQTIQEEKTTIYVGVPAVYSFMLESKNIGNFDISSLRILDYGGAPMPKQIILNLFNH